MLRLINRRGVLKAGVILSILIIGLALATGRSSDKATVAGTGTDGSSATVAGTDTSESAAAGARPAEGSAAAAESGQPAPVAASLSPPAPDAGSVVAPRDVVAASAPVAPGTTQVSPALGNPSSPSDAAPAAGATPSAAQVSAIAAGSANTPSTPASAPAQPQLSLKPLQVAARGTFSAVGAGFAAGAPVRLVANIGETSLALTNLVTAGDGSFSSNVTLPAGITPTMLSVSASDQAGHVASARLMVTR